MSRASPGISVTWPPPVDRQMFPLKSTIHGLPDGSTARRLPPWAIDPPSTLNVPPLVTYQTDPLAPVATSLAPTTAGRLLQFAVWVLFWPELHDGGGGAGVPPPPPPPPPGAGVQ